MGGETKEMTEEQTAMLQRGRSVVASIDAQLARMARVLELQTGERPAANAEEETRLRILFRTFAEWAKESTN